MGRRRNNVDDMTIREQIEEIKAEICDNYCLYRFTLSDQAELEGKCEQCPLTRL